ncbi:dirigent protein 4-like [Malania oleifera]|uniref:dirigent protein 4-like n=1 Tax=Malania oleifera TaxID=397392 RepID=UPI0025AE0390|nr:dirigent protein 4-like [Malania oleifera]
MACALVIVLMGIINLAPVVYSESVSTDTLGKKLTKLHFFFHDSLGGKSPSGVMVARANVTDTSGNAAPFGSVFAADDPLTEGPELTSPIIGNARGLYLSANQKNNETMLVMYYDFGFTTDEFNGSSISILSRNPVGDTIRELALVGGRGKFRMATGFAELKTYSRSAVDLSATIEYNVTVYSMDPSD